MTKPRREGSPPVKVITPDHKATRKAAQREPLRARSPDSAKA